MSTAINVEYLSRHLTYSGQIENSVHEQHVRQVRFRQERVAIGTMCNSLRWRSSASIDLCQGDVGRGSLEAVSLQPPIQLRPRQSKATRSFRFIPIGLVQDAFDRAPLDDAQITRR